MNIPNKLTLTRLILFIPLFFLLGTLASLDLQDAAIDYSTFDWKTWVWISAGVVFSLSVLTDYFDGKIARKTKQVTIFGKVFDPLADKVIINFCFLVFAKMGYVPWFIAVLFIVRDILVDGLRNIVVKEKISIQANFLGKAKTILQMIAIIVIFVAVPAMDTKHLIDKNKNYFMLSPFSKDKWVGKLWILQINSVLALIVSFVSMVWYYKINWRPLIESFSKTKIDFQIENKEEVDNLELEEEVFENQEEEKALENKEKETKEENLQNKKENQEEETFVNSLDEDPTNKTLESKVASKKQTKVVKKTTNPKTKKTTTTKNKKPLSEQKIDEILKPDEKKPWE